MELARIGVGVGKIEASKQPLLRARAESGVNVKITFAHIELEAALTSLLANPILISCWHSKRRHLSDKIDNLSPNGRMRKIGRMNAQPDKRLMFLQSTQCSIPSQTRSPSPAIANAVNKRADGKCFSRPQIAHAGEPSRVFHFRVARRALSFQA